MQDDRSLISLSDLSVHFPPPLCITQMLDQTKTHLNFSNSFYIHALNQPLDWLINTDYFVFSNACYFLLLWISKTQPFHAHSPAEGSWHAKSYWDAWALLGRHWWPSSWVLPCPIPTWPLYLIEGIRVLVFCYHIPFSSSVSKWLWNIWCLIRWDTLITEAPPPAEE